MADLTLTDQNFTSNVLESDKPVLVDFWAPWCPPCKMLDPIMKELEKDYEGKMVLGKMNTDENLQVAEQFNIMSLPTIMLFKGGQPIKVLIGAQGKQTYKQNIEEVLAS